MRKLSRIDVKKTLDKVDTSVENERMQMGVLREETLPAWNTDSDLRQAIVSQ